MGFQCLEVRALLDEYIERQTASLLCYMWTEFRTTQQEYSLFNGFTLCEMSPAFGLDTLILDTISLCMGVR